MSKLLSFLGGVGTGFLSSVEKAEANAKEEALLRVKRLTENYEKVKEENGKLTNSLKAEESWIKTYYPDATPEQVAYLQGSPDALQALKKMKDPTKISLSEVINIKAANESNAVVMERIEDLPKVADAVGSKIKAAMPAYRRGLAGLYDEFGEQAGKTAEMRYARAAGVDVQTMEALKPMQRPTQAGTIDIAALRDQPGSIEEIIKTGKVTRFQAEQKFGKDSDQFKQADAEVKAAESQIVTTDKKLEDRRDRLELQRRDSKDPAVVAAMTKEINGINADIKARREATSTAREKAGAGEGSGNITYAKAKARLDDYSNTDLSANRGLDWRKHVVDKVVKDPATGETITIPGKKVGLNPQEEKEFIEGLTQTRIQGLKDLGLVTEKGQPINNEVAQLMTSYGLRRTTQTTAPAQTTGQTAAPTQAPKSAVSVDAARAEARAAIAKGANAAAVAKRFKETTGQEL